MDDFEQLVASMPEPTFGQTQMDVSEFLGQSAGTRILTFREPSAAELYQARKLIKRIQLQFPTWTDEYALSVATLGICFQGQTTSKKPMWLLFAHFVNRLGPKGFFTVQGKFVEAFPHLKDMNAEADEEKNEFGETPSLESV